MISSCVGDCSLKNWGEGSLGCRGIGRIGDSCSRDCDPDLGDKGVCTGDLGVAMFCLSGEYDLDLDLIGVLDLDLIGDLDLL